MKSVLILSISLIFFHCSSNKLINDNVNINVFHLGKQTDRLFTDPYTGIHFSPKLCDLTKVGSIIFEQKELGISFAYANDDDFNVCFYVFNDGHKIIENGCNSPIVKGAFDRALQDLLATQKLGVYKNVTIGEKSYIDFIMKGKKLTALFTECSYFFNNISVKSYVFMSCYQNHMLKIRFTYPHEFESKVQEIWQCVLNSFNKHHNSYDFVKLKDIKLDRDVDFKGYESDVLQCTSLLLSNPPDTLDVNRGYARQFVVRWSKGTPDYTFSLYTFIANIIKDNVNLFSLYLASYIENVINKQYDNDTDSHKAALRTLFAYCFDKNYNVGEVKNITALKKIFDDGSEDSLFAANLKLNY